MKKFIKNLSLCILLLVAMLACFGCTKPDDGKDDPKPATVTLNMVGATTVTSEINLDNSNYANLPTTNKSGYEFLGWSLSENGDVVFNKNLMTFKYDTIKTYLAGDTITLYAIYKELGTDPVIDEIDYAKLVKLDYSNDKLKQEVTVKNFVDGDTTHFNVPESVSETGVLKARYLGINTPESTGKIEEYGKTASKFTHEKLENAVSIVVESDTSEWNIDSTGSRFLVWVWYKTSEDSEYRNLNIELLQNGLAIASNSANNTYGTTCMAAIEQAKTLKLNVYSGQKDPNFFYGDAVEVTLAELRENIADYNGIKVAFEAVVTKVYSNTAYVEAYDEETGVYNGIAVYYGLSASGDVISIMSTGNKVRVVGSVQLYETAGTYQIAGLQYRAMKPNDPSNVQKLGEGYEASYTLVSANDFKNKTFDIEKYVEDENGDEQLEINTFTYAELAMNSTIKMENLKVKFVYTTTDESSSSKGALTLTCECDGISISIRTVVLTDASGNVIKEDAYMGKTIDVKGLVDYYNGTYQIKVYSASDITVK